MSGLITENNTRFDDGTGAARATIQFSRVGIVKVVVCDGAGSIRILGGLLCVKMSIWTGGFMRVQRLQR
jgi:hypothetical protein